MVLKGWLRWKRRQSKASLANVLEHQKVEFKKSRIQKEYLQNFLQILLILCKKNLSVSKVFFFSACKCGIFCCCRNKELHSSGISSFVAWFCSFTRYSLSDLHHVHYSVNICCKFKHRLAEAFFPCRRQQPHGNVGL